MFYRFTLAAVVAATTLTGCAAHKSASTTASISAATQAADAPVAATPAVQPVQTEQPVPPAHPVQPVQTQPITAPGAVTEPATAPVADAATVSATPTAAAAAETANTPAEAPAAAAAPAVTDTATASTAAAAPAVTDTATAPTAPAAPAVTDTAAAATPAKESKISAAEGTQAIAPFSSGPTQIDVSHIVTRADDGSSITLTIDGTEAGILKRGEKRVVFVEPGKHKVGGYVQTLFGLGRVTIPAVEITTVPGKVKNVAYSVTKTRPAFTEAKDSTNTPG